MVPRRQPCRRGVVDESRHSAVSRRGAAGKSTGGAGQKAAGRLSGEWVTDLTMTCSRGCPNVQKLFAAAAIAFLLTPLVAFAQDTESINVVGAGSAPIATLLVPRSGIQPSEIGVVVNVHDPQSVDI